MKRFSFNWRSGGYSLIEVLMAVALMSILVSLATSSLSSLLESSRLRALTNDFMDDLRLTRSEAIVRGRRVAMCTSAANDTCSAIAGWQQGWLMFVDANNNGLREAAELIVRHHAAAPEGWLLSGNLPVSHYVSYDALGSSRLVGGGFQAGTVTICRGGVGATKARSVVINSLGRPRSEQLTVAECV